MESKASRRRSPRRRAARAGLSPDTSALARAVRGRRARIATVHLISGLPCAGKTTYAERLREERDAVLLSLDRWLITSFGRYRLDVVGYEEHRRRVYACRELIWSVAVELLRRRVDVILDDGFFLRVDRRRHVDLARGIGAAAAIHFVDMPADVVRARLGARNRAPGDYHFEIAPEDIAGFTAFFEAPSTDEGADLIVVREAPQPPCPPGKSALV